MKTSTDRTKPAAGGSASRIKSPPTKPVKTTKSAIKRAVRAVLAKQASARRA
jgi:hypothetical protein